MASSRPRLPSDWLTATEEEEEGAESETEAGSPTTRLSDATFEEAAEAVRTANASLPRSASWLARACNVLAQLLASEELYLSQLRLLHLKARPALAGHLSAQEERILFSNLGTLLQFHTYHQEPALRLALARAEDGRPPLLTQLFLGLAPWLYLYTDYARAYQAGQAVLLALGQRSRAAAAVVAEIEAAPENAAPIAAAFLAPVQALVRYELLFREYLRGVPMGHAERRDATEALLELQKGLRDTREYLRPVEAFFEVRMVADLLGLDGLLTPGRQFVREGHLLRLPNRGGRPLPRRLFLFNDVLLVCRKSRLAALGFPLRLRQLYALVELRLAWDESDPSVFHLRGSADHGTFRASSQAEAEDWLATLARLKGCLHARTASLS